MTRKEFMLNSINKALKSIFYLALLLFGIYFFNNAYKNEAGVERGFILGGLVIMGVILVLGLLSFLFDSVWKKTSEKTKILFKKLDRILFFALLPFFIYLIYIKWDHNKWGIIGFLAVSLFLYLKNKQTKPI